jgi:DNA helicase-2/ATP-dependent DNA helicase PcrA
VNVPVRTMPQPLPKAPPAKAPPVSVAPVQSAQRGLFGNPPAPVQTRSSLPKAPPPPKHPARTGTVVEHPKYGTGTIVRREGEGDDAKIVVIFQRYGMKKLVEKYAGLK